MTGNKPSILLVFAHPDDESFGLAGTITKYTRQGVTVDLVCATRGEKGSRLGVPRNVATGTARECELRAAASITGIRNIYFLGYMDAEVNRVNKAELVGKILQVMRKVKPAVVITFGPDGITGHWDHIAVGKAATQAYERMSAEGNGSPKLYYVTIPQSVVPDAEESGLSTRPDDEVTTSIDITEFLDFKIKAISAHRSQRYAREFIKMLQEEKEANSVIKEYLYRASPQGLSKETDLFE